MGNSTSMNTPTKFVAASTVATSSDLQQTLPEITVEPTSKPFYDSPIRIARTSFDPRSPAPIQKSSSNLRISTLKSQASVDTNKLVVEDKENQSTNLQQEAKPKNEITKVEIQWDENSETPPRKVKKRSASNASTSNAVKLSFGN